jgi:23S rRNA (adenine2503-C2)-methyltransferase
MGFGGNLTSDEIVDQVLYFARSLKPKLQKVTNIVFMGMGEPMLNLANVESAIEIFTNPEKMAMSVRRITISTSGYLPQFKQLVDHGFRGRVAISLHAPNQELREKLMPVAKIYPLNNLMKTLDEYVELNNKRVSYEYVLIKNVNDQDEHALQLADLLKGRLAHVNLIPYNPISERDFVRSNREQITRFTKLLEKHKINHSLRVTMGDDVNAACGQLADRENKRNISRKINI